MPPLFYCALSFWMKASSHSPGTLFILGPRLTVGISPLATILCTVDLLTLRILATSDIL